MKSKKGLILGIVLLLLTMVVGSVFAVNTAGVEWYHENNRTVMINQNSYGVYITPTLENGSRRDRFYLGARERTYVNGVVKSIVVSSTTFLK
jgi:hypothetical protein